jgi:putative hemolysin
LNPWTIVIFTLIASAFASGCEIAFLSANKLRIELDRKQGNFAARILWGFVKSPGKFMAAMLLLNNIALVMYGIAMSEEIMTEDIMKGILPVQMHSQVWLMVVQTLFATLIILVAAEFFPKVIFRIDANGILNFLAIPLRIIYLLLYPLVFVVMTLARFILTKIARVEFAEEKPVFGRIDLDFYIQDLTTKNPQEEELQTDMRIFQNALDFNEVKVWECMVPREEIISIGVDESIDALRKLFIETKLSRLLVYRDSVDNIIGFVHSNELFQKPNSIMQVLLPITVVPEVMAASELLSLFIKERKSIAVVVDEFGGTSGVVTIEDVMEEIFGEIQDEHDEQEFADKKVGENEYIFSGRVEIDALNKKYGLNIPESQEYETLTGFILHHHENIPEPNEKIAIPPFTFTVMFVQGTSVGMVRMKVDRTED